MAIVKGAGLVMKAIIEVSLSGNLLFYNQNLFVLSLVFIICDDDLPFFVFNKGGGQGDCH